ncbi:hypothetical protein OIU74_027427 [Salix koriyanagi]|uniref:Uncharacterized protein n=1 Tax=Salix koriyanagi TaxID=2511006 RepID=A0A9Q0VRY9_9ROSI|nr:hypothetical protein OIU74_027427 [Salix koriyanagi]
MIRFKETRTYSSQPILGIQCSSSKQLDHLCSPFSQF